MKGQLWEECWCGIEPVCVNCMKCKYHCDCKVPKQKIDFKTFKTITKDDEFSIPHPARRYD